MKKTTWKKKKGGLRKSPNGYLSGHTVIKKSCQYLMWISVKSSWVTRWEKGLISHWQSDIHLYLQTELLGVLSERINCSMTSAKQRWKNWVPISGSGENAAWAKAARHTRYHIHMWFSIHGNEDERSLKELHKLIACVISTYLLTEIRGLWTINMNANCTVFH